MSVVLEEDESESATCWFKDDDDDATIAWFEDYASWPAGRISTSGSVCSAVSVLDVDTEGSDFFQKESNVFSDVSVYLHVSIQLFSPELVFPHQVYF